MQTKARYKSRTTPKQHRIATLDVLRGLALVGILLVNMEYYSQSGYDSWAQPEFDGWRDTAARWFVIALFQLKAYLLFALLFGYGIGMQLQGQESNSAVKANHLRRMFMLAILGIAHATLLFSGDILLTYSLLGVISIGLWHSSSARLIVWSVLAFAAGIFNGLLLVMLLPMLPEAMLGSTDMAVANAIYAHGTVLQVIAQRLVDLSDALPFILLIQGPMSLAMLLLGIVMARVAVLTSPHRHSLLLQRLIRWGLPVGVLGSAAAATLTLGDSVENLAASIGFLLQLLVAPAFCLAFVACIARLGSEPLPRWLKLVAHSGRMSLTIYLGQSLVCALLFTSYGLGLFGQMGPAACLLIAIVVSIFFVVFSHQWFRRWRFGPLEWLLRSGTYWRWQKFKKEVIKADSIFVQRREP